jgi:acyl-coenzyme A synthetase/AMP-(fatty) acid ligase
MPSKTAIVVEGKSYTYGERCESSQKLASVLVARGLNRGDRVAIYMDNTWPCVVSIYAVVMAGGVFLLINPQTKVKKLVFLLRDSGACILLTDGHLSTVFLPALAEINDLLAVLISGNITDTIESSGFDFVSFREAVENTELLNLPRVTIPNDLVALIYTSGSTGFPKGVMQTHQAMTFSTWSLLEYLRLSENDRILLVLPIAFDYGLYQLLMSVRLGATLIIERSFTFPQQVYNRLLAEEVTVFPAVPTIYSMMISSYKKKIFSFPSVTRITNTAAVLAADYIPWLKKIFPNALIYKMYGLTECKRVSYLEPELIDSHPTSVGKAIPGTEIFLLSEDGELVENGGEGILYVRGPHTMVGYWNQPEKTREMIKPGKIPGEKILCTHDTFRMDKEGLFYFVGRNDEIIKSRGEKVSPVEVENMLNSLLGVKESAVIGVFDEVLGKAIKAYIVLEAGCELNERGIRKMCFSHLENYMVPKYIKFVDVLNKTANGKIDKKKLSEIS